MDSPEDSSADNPGADRSVAGKAVDKSEDMSAHSSEDNQPDTGDMEGERTVLGTKCPTNIPAPRAMRLDTLLR